jgi:hypothetical protein
VREPAVNRQIGFGQLQMKERRLNRPAQSQSALYKYANAYNMHIQASAGRILRNYEARRKIFATLENPLAVSNIYFKIKTFRK